MGPSGAGKSTLLDVLSGYRTTGVDGSVYTNGRIRNLDSFRKVSCYITQEDRIQTLLTVSENMYIAAEFKLGNRMAVSEKQSRVSPFNYSFFFSRTFNESYGSTYKCDSNFLLSLFNNRIYHFSPKRLKKSSSYWAY